MPKLDRHAQVRDGLCGVVGVGKGEQHFARVQMFAAQALIERTHRCPAHVERIEPRLPVGQRLGCKGVAQEHADRFLTDSGWCATGVE